VLEKGTHFLQKPFSIDAMRLKSIKRLEEGNDVRIISKKTTKLTKMRVQV